MQSKVYAARGFYDQSLQFISKYYFPTKTVDDYHYRTVRNIMDLLTYLLMLLILVVAPIAARRVHKNIYKFVNWLSNYPVTIILSNKQSGITPQAKIAQIGSMFSISIVLTLALLVVHAFSVKRYIEYGDEVLYCCKTGDNYIPMKHALYSFIAIGSTILAAVGFSLNKIYIKICSRSSGEKDYNDLMLYLISTSITVNIIYMGSYFVPFMILAFIHDPLQTTFTYFVVAAFFACICLTFYGFWTLSILIFPSKLLKKDDRDLDNNRKHMNPICIKLHSICATFHRLYTPLICTFTLLASAFSMVCFLLAIIYITTLGSFSDYQDLKILLLPAVVGVFSFFIWKPVYQIIRAKYNKKHQKKSHNDVLQKV